MTPTEIFLPAMALMGWTLGVLLWMPYQRFKAVSSGQVTLHDFKLGESPRVPSGASIPNRCFMNLLEAPVLFYLIITFSFVTKNADGLLTALAWLYVALRGIQSLVHLTYNNVLHRGSAFAASNGVLGVMWAKLFIALMAG